MVSLETDPNPIASFSYALNEAMEGNNDDDDDDADVTSNENGDITRDDNHENHQDDHDDDDDEALLPSLNLDECNAITDYAKNNNNNNNTNASSQPQQQQQQQQQQQRPEAPTHIPPPTAMAMAYSSFPPTFEFDDNRTRSQASDNGLHRHRDGLHRHGGTKGRPRKKSSLGVRWLVLGLACAVMSGSYYA